MALVFKKKKLFLAFSGGDRNIRHYSPLLLRALRAAVAELTLTSRAPLSSRMAKFSDEAAGTVHQPFPSAWGRNLLILSGRIAMSRPL